MKRSGAVALLCVLPVLAFAKGATSPNVTSANIHETICIPGYTKTVRPSVAITNRIKHKLLRDAGIGESHIIEYELDHVIPLALGGHQSRLENLPLHPRECHYGAKRKDRIEVKLQCLLCSGRVPRDQARPQSAYDWHAADHRYAFVPCHRYL